MIRLSCDVAVALTGDAFRFQCRRPRRDPVVLSNLAVDAVEKRSEMPNYQRLRERRPDIVEAMFTRRDLGEGREEAPIMHEGLVRCGGAAERLIGEGLREACPRALKKPRIVVAGRLGIGDQAKHGLINLFRMRGRQVFLTHYPMACALGLELPVVDKPVHGVLALESDWCEFAAIRYADELVETSQAVGIEHLVRLIARRLNETQGNGIDAGSVRRLLRERGMTAEGTVPIRSDPIDSAGGLLAVDPAALDRIAEPWLDRIVGDIKDALAELTDEQTASLKENGVYLCGDGSEAPGLEAALAVRLGVPVVASHTTPHPALRGAMVYTENINQWSLVLRGTHSRRADAYGL